ncbi:MAG: DsbA family protein [Ghiorsea sp.]|nr:DsbA family protein [Ghiorsea sp.]
MSTKKTTLYYAHDPMCSWCFGFRPVWQEVTAWCQEKVNIEYLMGGLAPDSDDIMPQSMQSDIQSYWKKIELSIPGTQFNFDFWKSNQPRRSTYRSCRAVICTRVQQPKKLTEMIRLIQNAYYQNAKNPSDREPLIECAKQCGLDIERFSQDLDAPYTKDLLRLEMLQCHQLGLNSFPSLLLEKQGEFTSIALDYNNAQNIIQQIKEQLN